MLSIVIFKRRKRDNGKGAEFLRHLLTGLGFLLTGLGVLGVILPILPTTPFLLLAVFCFSKGSQRFHDWLIQTNLYQKHLADFSERHEMTLRTKVTLLAFSSAMILMVIYFSSNVYLRGFLGFLVVFKYYYFIFKIKTVIGR